MQKNIVSKWGKWRLRLLMGVAIVLAAPLIIGAFRTARKVANKPGPTPVGAWDTKVKPQLDRLDQVAAGVAEKHLSRISAFFSEKKRGARQFADWAYGWTAKFYAMKGNVQGDNGAGFRQWLQGKFEETVFRGEDLQAVLASVIDGYVTEMQGLENDTLVQIRADIAQDDLFQGNMPVLQTDQAFRDEYRRLSEDLLPKVLDDLGIGAGGFLTNTVLSEVAARSLGPRLAGVLGISGEGLLSTLGRSGAVIGVGLAAFWALDKLIDWLLNLFGYGPSGELAGQVEQSLVRLESNLIDGDPTPVVEPQIQQESGGMGQGGRLGLRREFQKLQELQSKLRREALHKLVIAQGGQ